MFGKSKTETQVDLELFTIYDSKSRSYDQPVFEVNENVLKREVINMFKNPQNRKNKFFSNAEDYSIFRIGTYDKKTGLIQSVNLEHVANMHDLRSIAGPLEATLPHDPELAPG